LTVVVESKLGQLRSSRRHLASPGSDKAYWLVHDNVCHSSLPFFTLPAHRILQTQQAHFDKESGLDMSGQHWGRRLAESHCIKFISRGRSHGFGRAVATATASIRHDHLLHMTHAQPHIRDSPRLARAGSSCSFRPYSIRLLTP
jgi:hypothetical protein